MSACSTALRFTTFVSAGGVSNPKLVYCPVGIPSNDVSLGRVLGRLVRSATTTTALLWKSAPSSWLIATFPSVTM